jgi:hypothetical protein
MGYSYVYPPLKPDQTPAAEFEFQEKSDSKTPTPEKEDQQTKVISVEEVPAAPIDTDAFVTASEENDNPKTELDSFVKSVDGEIFLKSDN